MVRQEPNNHAIINSLSPPTARRRGFVRGNMLLIGVFAAGILCVCVLGLRQPPQGASGQQSPSQMPAESQLEGLGKGKPNGELKPGEGMGIVHTFYYQAKQRQIPIEALPGNPFVSRSPRLAAPPVAQTPTKGDDAHYDSLIEAIEQVKTLKLQSVMVGSGKATAMISGQILTEGKKIQAWTVVHIEPREVILAWGDQKFVLKMPE